MILITFENHNEDKPKISLPNIQAINFNSNNKDKIIELLSTTNDKIYFYNKFNSNLMYELTRYIKNIENFEILLDTENSVFRKFDPFNLI